MEALAILAQLLCAHLCADFIFQTDGINSGKRRPGSAGVLYLLLHSATHAVTSYIFLAEWRCWQAPLIILATHFAIDFIKCRFTRHSLRTFLTDQLWHVAVILLLWLAFFSDGFDWSLLRAADSAAVWVTAMAYLLMLRPSSIFLSLFLDKWTPTSATSQSLPNAGKWIGYIERVLILTFVLAGSVEGVGFLLAAKSVFRFGELNKAKEIRTTEYVLIGTLASFSIAILTGMAVLRMV